MLRRHWAHAKASAPTLEQKHRKYYLRFTYEEHGAQGTVNVKNKPVSSQKRVQKPSSVIQSLELYGNELNDSGDFLWRLVVLLGLKQQID
jgi:hypothetical protein